MQTLPAQTFVINPIIVTRAPRMPKLPTLPRRRGPKDRRHDRFEHREFIRNRYHNATYAALSARGIHEWPTTPEYKQQFRDEMARQIRQAREHQRRYLAKFYAVRLAEQAQRSQARLRVRFALFGGQLPADRPIDAPVKPKRKYTRKPKAPKAQPTVNLSTFTHDAIAPAHPSMIAILNPEGSAVHRIDTESEFRADSVASAPLTVVIKGREYHATALPTGPEGHRAYRLESGRSDYEVRETPTGRAECSCPDYAARHADLPHSDGCKHVMALVDAGMLDNRSPAEWDAMADDAADREAIDRGLTISREPTPYRIFWGEETAEMSQLKLKGRRLYRDGILIAEILGCREWVKGTPHGEFAVWQGSQKVASGFCYFRDAVRWAKDVLKDADPPPKHSFLPEGVA